MKIFLNTSLTITVLFAVFLISGCVSTPKAGTPYIEVYNQNVTGETVEIEYIVSVGPGWIVIHTDQNGKPGEVIGYTAVADGINKAVTVKIDASKKTDTLIAMLHLDTEVIGTYDFPVGDPPARTGDSIVMKSFATKEMPQSFSPSMGGGGY